MFGIKAFEKLVRIEEFVKNHDSEEKAYREHDDRFKRELRDLHADEIVKLKSYDAGQNSQIRKLKEDLDRYNIALVEKITRINAIVDIRGKIYFSIMVSILTLICAAVITNLFTRIFN